MLEEFTNLRQEKGGFRRLFTDNYFDLYFWYAEDKKEFIGFQLVYAVNRMEMALTVYKNEKPTVHRIISGDNQFYSPTNLINGEGIFLKDQLIEEFKNRAVNIDQNLQSIVLEVLNGY